MKSVKKKPSNLGLEALAKLADRMERITLYEQHFIKSKLPDLSTISRVSEQAGALTTALRLHKMYSPEPSSPKKLHEFAAATSVPKLYGSELSALKRMSEQAGALTTALRLHKMYSPEPSSLKKLHEFAAATSVPKLYGSELSALKRMSEQAGALTTALRLHKMYSPEPSSLKKLHEFAAATSVPKLYGSELSALKRMSEQAGAFEANKTLLRLYHPETDTISSIVEHTRVASELQRHFGFTKRETGADTFALLKKLQIPGFQMAAVLGVEGAAPQGIIADVLHHYDNRDDVAPAFGMVLDAAHLVDKEICSPTDITDIAVGLRGGLCDAIEERKENILLLNLIIGLFLATITFYITYQMYLLAQNSATSQDIAIQTAVTREVRNEIAALRADNRNKDIHVRQISSTTYLRVEPHAKAMKIRAIYPDQWVQALDERGDWVKIEVVEYYSEKPVMGWVNRRHLRRMR